jgi:hypothetical protein
MRVGAPASPTSRHVSVDGADAAALARRVRTRQPQRQRLRRPLVDPRRLRHDRATAFLAAP